MGRCLGTAVVSLFVSWSLRSNGSTCHIIFAKFQHAIPYSFCETGCEHKRKKVFFGMLPAVKVIVTSVLCKLKSSYGVCMEANEVLFPWMYNLHRVGLVSV
jgi:hypothetical protein